MNDPSSPPRWSSCPAGKIDEVIQRRHVVQRREMLKYVSLASLTLVGTAGIGSYMLQSPPQPQMIYRLSCQTVLDSLGEFYAGQLEPQMISCMRSHLLACAGCRRVLFQQFPDASI